MPDLTYYPNGLCFYKDGNIGVRGIDKIDPTWDEVISVLRIMEKHPILHQKSPDGYLPSRSGLTQGYLPSEKTFKDEQTGIIIVFE